MKYFITFDGRGVNNIQLRGCCEFLHSRNTDSYCIISLKYISLDELKKFISLLNNAKMNVNIVEGNFKLPFMTTRDENTFKTTVGNEYSVVKIPPSKEGYIAYTFLRYAMSKIDAKRIKDAIKFTSRKRKPETKLWGLLKAFSDTAACSHGSFCFRCEPTSFVPYDKWELPKIGNVQDHFSRLFKNYKHISTYYKFKGVRTTLKVQNTLLLLKSASITKKDFTQAKIRDMKLTLVCYAKDNSIRTKYYPLNFLKEEQLNELCNL